MTNQELKPGQKVRLRGSSKLYTLTSLSGYYRKAPDSKHKALRVVMIKGSIGRSTAPRSRGHHDRTGVPQAKKNDRCGA